LQDDGGGFHAQFHLFARVVQHRGEQRCRILRVIAE
jgi:hypothetical protein